MEAWVEAGVVRRVEEGGLRGVARAVGRWWMRGWVAFVRAAGEPYLPMGGGSDSMGLPDASRGEDRKGAPTLPLKSQGSGSRFP